MLETILRAVTALSEIFNQLIKMFKKSTTEKVLDQQKSVQEKFEESKKTGRPT